MGITNLPNRVIVRFNWDNQHKSIQQHILSGFKESRAQAHIQCLKSFLVHINKLPSLHFNWTFCLVNWTYLFHNVQKNFLLTMGRIGEQPGMREGGERERQTDRKRWWERTDRREKKGHLCLPSYPSFDPISIYQGLIYFLFACLHTSLFNLAFKDIQCQGPTQFSKFIFQHSPPTSPIWFYILTSEHIIMYIFSFCCSVTQSCPTLWPRICQHTRLLSPSIASQSPVNFMSIELWCHPTISSSVVPFSSCLSQHQDLF